MAEKSGNFYLAHARKNPRTARLVPISAARDSGTRASHSLLRRWGRRTTVTGILQQ